MSGDPIHWIAVDSSVPHEEIKAIAGALTERFGEGCGHIVSTKEVEPMTKEERERYVNKLVEALEDD